MTEMAYGGHLTRSELILKGAFAAGAAYGLGMAGPYAREALSAAGGDVDILNFLLPFEYTQLDIYNQGLNELKLSHDQEKLIGLLAREEREHVKALIATIEKLGGRPVPKGDYSFSARGAYELLRLAGYLEVSAIGAYNGSMASIKSKAVKEMAASIVQVEGRHSAAIYVQRYEEPAPEAFDKSLTQFQALNSLLKFAGPAIFDSI